MCVSVSVTVCECDSVEGEEETSSECRQLHYNSRTHTKAAVILLLPDQECFVDMLFGLVSNSGHSCSLVCML